MPECGSFIFLYIPFAAVTFVNLDYHIHNSLKKKTKHLLRNIWPGIKMFPFQIDEENKNYATLISELDNILQKGRNLGLFDTHIYLLWAHILHGNSRSNPVLVVVKAVIENSQAKNKG